MKFYLAQKMKELWIINLMINKYFRYLLIHYIADIQYITPHFREVIKHNGSLSFNYDNENVIPVNKIWSAIRDAWALFPDGDTFLSFVFFVYLISIYQV